jgi:hypothetical protein
VSIVTMTPHWSSQLAHIYPFRKLTLGSTVPAGWWSWGCTSILLEVGLIFISNQQLGRFHTDTYTWT